MNTITVSLGVICTVHELNIKSLQRLFTTVGVQARSKAWGFMTNIQLYLLNPADSLHQWLQRHRVVAVCNSCLIKTMLSQFSKCPIEMCTSLLGNRVTLKAHRQSCFLGHRATAMPPNLLFGITGSTSVSQSQVAQNEELKMKSWKCFLVRELES